MHGVHHVVRRGLRPIRVVGVLHQLVLAIGSGGVGARGG